jgi:hypothetical protein
MSPRAAGRADSGIALKYNAPARTTASTAAWSQSMHAVFPNVASGRTSVPINSGIKLLESQSESFGPHSHP